MRWCLRPFQYSLTNLVWCNKSLKASSVISSIVSVFSDESRVVQQQTGEVTAPGVIVSVFSDESRVVQHRTKRALDGKSSEFQYSLTNLVWCNKRIGDKSTNLKWFQYSLTNLVWCNRDRHGHRAIRRTFQYSLTNLVWCNRPRRPDRRD